jgi:hypothetical protein
MTTYAWPAFGSDKAFWPATAELGQWHNNRELESSLSGDIQTNSVPGAKWLWTLNFDPQTWPERARLWAFLTRLSGKQHRTQLFAPHQPVPTGSINLAGVTVKTLAAQFATSIVLQGCGNTKTLLRGDWFSVNGQPLMCVVDATSNAGGDMTVEFRHPLRAAAAVSAAVTLSSPFGLYILNTSEFGTPYGTGNMAPPVSIPFREVFS